MPTLTFLAVVAAVLALTGLVVPAAVRGYRARRRSPSALASRAGLAAVAVVAAAAAVGAFVGWGEVVVPALAVWVLSCLWLPRSSRWSAAAHASWSLSLVAGAAYVVSMAWWTAVSSLTGLSAVAAWGLWLLELVAFLLFLSYGYEFHDSLGSRRWDRRVGPAVTPVPDSSLPFVSVHVPCHNEPPEMVIATLETLLRLDYPSYEVLVVDNNTVDDSLVIPVEAFCAEHSDVLRFHRLLNWPGYKSGALNYAESVTDSRATLIGVVDSDYQVEPDWLRDTAPLFADERVGFVQTPQDYRFWRHAHYLRSLYYSYQYFFSVSQPSRDERDAAIFGGTMGLVRRAALRKVGGWDEWCVTEDAELSLRLLAAGWTGHHLDRAYGAGIMPLTFEALKRQRFRWCFGGMQILRKHGSELLPWAHTRMSRRQRFGYLAGGVQWLGDLLSLVFAVVVMASLWDWAIGAGVVVRQVGGLLLFAVPGLLLLGLIRALAGIRSSGSGATWADASGAFLLWLSLGWVVSLACVRGLTEPSGVFLRTPKVHSDARPLDALRANAVELGFALCALATVVTALTLHPGWTALGLSVLLVLPVCGWLAAPFHSIAALRTALPSALQRRRDRERRVGLPSSARWSLGSMVATGAVAGLLLLVLQPRAAQPPPELVLPSLSGNSPTVATPVPTSTTPPTVPAVTTSPASDSPSTEAPGRTSGTVSGTSTPAPSTVMTAPSASPTAVPTVTSTAGSAATGRPTGSPTAPPGSPTSHPGPTQTR